ncbi:MAG: DUF6273 domain-containing protein, partial [Treponemataceae bacterium]|nr:DUF6273 domain-containing protein [Treponemataceae bacterium]
DSSVTVNDESEKVTMGANTYYEGDDGNLYAKVAENAYATGDEYTYSDGSPLTKSSENSYRYFKVEPIKWRVLTNNYGGSGKSLLLAEEILNANVPYYNYKDANNLRSVGSDSNIYSSNYKYSQIRAYLNGLDYYVEGSTSTVKKTDYSGKGFFQTAFTEAAQSLIATTEVDNSKETTGWNEQTCATEYVCANTADKIFLLSEREAINSAYGFSQIAMAPDEKRIWVPTDYAKANYAYQNPTEGNGGYWWLRSPDYGDRCYANYVNIDGYVGYGWIRNNHFGIVPALTISLK